MPVLRTHQTISTACVIIARATTDAGLAEARTDAVDVLETVIRLGTNTRVEPAHLIARTPGLYAAIGTFIPKTNTTRITIRSEDTVIALWTATVIATDSSSGAVIVFTTWINARVRFADPIAKTVNIITARGGLSAEPCIQRADLITDTVVVATARIDTPLIIGTDPVTITVFSVLAKWSFATSAVVATHSRTRAI